MSADVAGQCMALVSPAENAFRSRWKLSTLKRVDADLYQLLVEQLDLWNTAMVTGSDAEARVQSEAMVRGWRAACASLESPLTPDDAYFVGFDDRTGTRVVIADRTGCQARVQSVYELPVTFVTPDEVARIMAGMTCIIEAKRFFPDAEVIDPQEIPATTTAQRRG